MKPLPDWEIDGEVVTAADLVLIGVAACADSGREHFVRALCELADLLARLESDDNVEPELDLEIYEVNWEDEDECWEPS